MRRLWYDFVFSTSDPWLLVGSTALPRVGMPSGKPVSLERNDRVLGASLCHDGKAAIEWCRKTTFPHLALARPRRAALFRCS